MQNENPQTEEKPMLPRQAWHVKEFCQIAGISNSSFWKYAGLGKIKIIRLGGRVLVPVAEANRIMSEGLN